MSASANSSVKKKFNWLAASAWGAGSAIFGWLLAGVCYQRDYRYLTWDALGWADWVMTFVFGGLTALLAFGIFLKRNKTSANHELKSDVDSSDTFSRVLSALLPALYLVLALATLVLTLATYNGDWMEARQGLATGFAALLAAVGAIISVYVTYKSGEENRKAQKDIEENKDKREQDKQDAETIKSLNDRLHNILDRRNSEDEKERISSYFQLAALYKDWDLLAENSEKIEKQRANQQKYILKLLFGTAKKDDDGNFIKVRTDDEDIALNSIISDIFITVNSNVEVRKNSISGNKNDKFIGYDLRYADLSYLKFYGKILENSNFSNASMEGAKIAFSSLNYSYFFEASLKGSNFNNSFLNKVDFMNACMDETDFMNAYLEEANFAMSSVRGVNFAMASLMGANFMFTSLLDVNFDMASLGNANFIHARISHSDGGNDDVLKNLSNAKMLPTDESILGLEGFTEEMLLKLKRMHKEINKWRNSKSRK